MFGGFRDYHLPHNRKMTTPACFMNCSLVTAKQHLVVSFMQFRMNTERGARTFDSVLRSEYATHPKQTSRFQALLPLRLHAQQGCYKYKLFCSMNLVSNNDLEARCRMVYSSPSRIVCQSAPIHHTHAGTAFAVTVKVTKAKNLPRDLATPICS